VKVSFAEGSVVVICSFEVRLSVVKQKTLDHCHRKSCLSQGKRFAHGKRYSGSPAVIELVGAVSIFSKCRAHFARSLEEATMLRQA
jgi:hypothetical protein